MKDESKQVVTKYFYELQDQSEFSKLSIKKIQDLKNNLCEKDYKLYNKELEIEVRE